MAYLFSYCSHLLGSPHSLPGEEAPEGGQVEQGEPEPSLAEAERSRAGQANKLGSPRLIQNLLCGAFVEEILHDFTRMPL